MIKQIKPFINKKKAFSLVELAIGFIVIGMLISGVLGGQMMLRTARIAMARSITASSPVYKTKGLIIWFDTIRKGSFGIGTSSPFRVVDMPSSDQQIGSWYDLPQKKWLEGGNEAPNNAQQTAIDRQPKFTFDSLNSLPGLDFDGRSDRLIFNDPTLLVNTDYTIFIVEGRHKVESGTFNNLKDNMFMGCTNTIVGADTPTCPHYGYRSNSSSEEKSVMSHSEDYIKCVIPLSDRINFYPRVHTFWFNKTQGMKYWLNSNQFSGSDATMTTAIQSWNGGANIGFFGHTNNGNVYYSGILGEIIIFNVALKDIDRKEIEQYIGKKWSIKLTL